MSAGGFLDLGVAVAAEVNLNALRHQTLTTGFAAAADNVLTVFGLHARAETKLLLARAFRGSVGRVHVMRLWSESC